MWIESFDSIEDAFESMRKSTAQANARATAEQKAITWGDYFEIPPEWNRGFMNPEGVHAFGRIVTREELEKAERDLGAPDEEIVETLARMDNAYERGYRFAWTYSWIEPDGELGSVHVVKMIKITEKQFEKGKASCR